MEIISVNVGLPQELTWRGETMLTGIVKAAVEGPVLVRRLNLEGDRQADLSVHGGPTKAVYAYPAQYYSDWREVLDRADLPWGSFGENLTIDGLDEEGACIGDVFQVGRAVLVVTEPRMPCSKLNARFQRADMGKLLLRDLRTGFYFGVVEEGEVQAGDEVARLSTHEERLAVADVSRLYTTERTNKALLAKAVSVDALPASWRDYFASRLSKLA